MLEFEPEYLLKIGKKKPKIVIRINNQYGIRTHDCIFVTNFE